MPKKSAEPWEKPAPKKTKHVKLTPASKAKAKASAKKAGRSRPSLVDNMNAAKAQKAGAKKKSGSRKSSSSTKSKATRSSRSSRAKKG